MSLLRNALKGSTAPSGLVSIERPIEQSDPELPDWVMSSVLAFLEPFVRGEGPEGGGDIFVDSNPRDFVREVERSFQVSLIWQGGRSSAAASLWSALQRDRGLLVRVLDFALQNLEIGYHFQSGGGAVQELDRALRQAGADYEVVPLEPNSVYHRLQRRTTTTTSAALQAQEAIGGDPSKHLANAWRAAYGQNPNPVTAYSEAVKAVEAAAIPIVLPNDDLATLGKVVGQLRATPQKYAAVFKRDVQISTGSNLSPVEVVTALADMLWVNQTDRHAPIVPIEQTQAEFAVHLALTLVQAFRSAVA